jgi:flagellar hook-basal body complex protein FliE
MSFDALKAAQAYGNAMKSATQSKSGEETGLNFGALVQSSMGQTQNSLRQAEKMTQAGAMGQAELVDVVTAVSAAEIQLETVTAIRDQVVSAYQEILRMPI